MPLITVLHDPSGINKKEFNPVPDGTKLRDWLIDCYGEDGFTIPTRLFKTPVCEANEIFLDQDINNPITLSGEDGIFIIHSPTDPITALIVGAIIGVIASVVLAPKAVPSPRIPEQENSVESPNNRLSGQTNIARPLQRIPDIYGRNKVWPDLIAKTYFEYVSNIKYVTEYLCIGRGEFLVEDLKSGETLIDDIAGASATVFDPNDDPALLLNVFTSTQVDGQEIAAPNDEQVTNITNLPINTLQNNGFFTFDGRASAFASMTAGETFTITNSVSNDGVYTFSEYIFAAGIGGLTPNIYTVEVDETFVTESDAVVDIVSSGGISSTVGPFVVPGDEVDSIWIDILAPQGLQKRESGNRDTFLVDFEIHIQEIDDIGDPVGAVDTRDRTIEGNTINALFYTFKFAPAALTTGVGYEVSVERTTNTDNATTVQMYDLTKWGRMAGVINLVDPEYGNVTTVLITTKATEQAVAASAREFNAVATRKLRTYDLDTQAILPTLTETKRFADAELEHLTDSFLGNKALAEIDLDELYTIQDALDNDVIYDEGELGLFSYSFSDQRVSVGDELLTIANSCRCYIGRQGNIVVFAREEEKDNRVTVFNGRNKQPNKEKKSYSFNKPSGNDGIELQFTPEQTNEGLIVVFPEDSVPENPIKIQAAGIKNFEQAWNRASLEYNKLLYTRQTVETTVTREGLFLLPTDRVGNVDGTNVDGQGGEIKAIDPDGVTIETYDEIDFTDSSTPFVVLRDDIGNATAGINVGERLDGVNGFILGTPPPIDLFVRGDNDYQVGTLYNFHKSATDNTVTDYTINQVTPVSNAYVKISMSNYGGAAVFSGDYTKSGGGIPLPEGDLDGGEKFRGQLGFDSSVATMQFKSGGDITDDVAFQFEDWFLPNTTAIGAFFEIKFTNLVLSVGVSGSSEPTFDVWLDLESNLIDFSVSSSDIPNGGGELTCDWEIRQKTDFLNNVIGTIKLHALVA